MRDIPLKAVKLVYFPKNTTSYTQPCDAGIIQALKLKYREQLHNHILGSLSSEQTAGAEKKSRNVQFRSGLFED